MRIGVDCGHTLTGYDYGSKGVIKDESYLTREVGIKVMNKLKALGHTVVNCTKDTCVDLNDSLSHRVNTANNNNVELFISIHFNAFNGNAHGVEVLTYGGKEIPEARRVLNNIVGLGYTNRGIKNGSGLYVLRNTKMKSMLIECCFCDNKNDMTKYNAEAFANAIVKGITGQTVRTQPKIESYIKLDGGGTIVGSNLAINLIIKDYKEVDRIFGHIEGIDNALWAFDVNPPNNNYAKLQKNANQIAVYKGLEPNKKYKILASGYKDGKKVTETSIVLKTLEQQKKVEEKLYRVQTGAFTNKKYAEDLRDELKEKGYKDTYIKEE